MSVLSETGNISEAARCVGLSRSSFYKLRSEDDEFQRLWRLAQEASIDLLEEEARKRATDGYDEPVVYGGKVVTDPLSGKPILKKKYSDALLIYLLRSSREKKDKEYGHGASEITVVISADEGEL
ncbi:hypothetical protein AA103196_0711 [Ameyamaea chiangmaiensis NBRC 103196]|uniref:DNA binding HTH domain-containing protein n=1 Tax=Ameyamaea chiangmaiensis TaxID=442969 RepID=A0A850PAG4_9PROT|nr:hypothetical protein [Ameyamaea chiangmaiensis]MBS4075813.1 hypothetical protein [Ameyamaea chiangmaiensis]NVN39316.1 hypothetical protein [Ameyamaea chiangmaiensis]GBQ63838.1 hypothetical protein AA103196_0711 [Ameyamaea chiangmaiensis NBRC 103196]